MNAICEVCHETTWSTWYNLTDCNGGPDGKKRRLQGRRERDVRGSRSSPPFPARAAFTFRFRLDCMQYFRVLSIITLLRNCPAPTIAFATVTAQ